MKMKQLMAFSLSCVMALTAFGGTALATESKPFFPDVPETHWAYNEIAYFASQKIIAGTGDGTFAPADSVTRESFVKMMVLTFHAPLNSPAVPSFTDVKPNRWSFPYIEVSRDFLTGYESPYDSTMTFRPEANATREDVAVALVRMMGLTDKDVQNSSTYRKFCDYEKISPSLIPYVNVAIEKGLISGIPKDGDLYFAAQAPISRAETVVLLNRAAKAAVTNVDEPLDMVTDLKSSDYGATATLTVTVPVGTAVTVNDETLKMTTSGERYVGTLIYKFAEEGSKSFKVVAKKAGKTKSETLRAEYSVDAPILAIIECPSTSSSKNVTVKGTMLDKKYSTTLKVNDKTVTSNSSVGEKKEWSTNVSLTAGINRLSFELKNSAGKTTTLTRTVTYEELGPQLAITECPAETGTKSITVKGTLSDANYSVGLTANGSEVRVSNGVWSCSFTLDPGVNQLTFVATNSDKKVVTVTKTITFTDAGPQIAMQNFPGDTTDLIAWDFTFDVKDANCDSREMQVSVNGERCSYEYFSGKYCWYLGGQKLVEGENKFVIVATNPSGKSITVEKTVVLAISAPELDFVVWPATASVAKQKIDAKLSVSDKNYDAANMKLVVNGEVWKEFDQNTNFWYSYYNESRDFQITLTPGENIFTFVLTNTAGKSTTEVRTITYNPV